MNEIVESIKYYVKGKKRSALLLTGDWGSGKTYFAKNSVVDEITKEDFECLYISLNGVKNTNEIVRQIIATKLKLSQNVIIGSSFLKSILDVGSLLPGFDKLKDISISNNDNLIKLFDFKKNFLIIDDLERISPEYNLSELFGFINTEFIEHNGYKVLFIANESEIEDKRYSKIKEKIIGHTYKFECNVSDVYLNYLEQIDEELLWFYKEYQKTILDSFRKYEINNLRTVFAIFDSLNYILVQLTKDIIQHHSFSLLGFIISITNEVKLGKITIEDIQTAKGLKNITETVRTKQMLAASKSVNRSLTLDSEDDEEPSYEEYFAQKYLNNNPNKFKFYECVFGLLLIGYVDPKKIVNEIVLTPDIPPWKNVEQIMLRYMDYDEETVKHSVGLVLDFAEKGEYPSMSYAYLYHWLFMFSQNHILKIRKDSLVKKLKNGFEISKNKNGLNYKSRDREYYSLSNKKDNPLSIHIDSTIAKLSKKEKKEDFNKIISLFDDDDKLYEYFEQNVHTGIFNNINIRELSKTIKKSKASSIFHFTRSVKHRYNYKNIYDHYISEISAIETLIEYLGKHRISKHKYPLRILSIIHLREIWEIY